MKMYTSFDYIDGETRKSVFKKAILEDIQEKVNIYTELGYRVQVWCIKDTYYIACI